MDEKDKKILDKLYQGKMGIEEAVKKLGKTENEVWEMLDDYEYVPTKEEVLRAFSTLRETEEHMKEKSVSVSPKSRKDVRGVSIAVSYFPMKVVSGEITANVAEKLQSSVTSFSTTNIGESHDLGTPYVRVENKPQGTSSAVEEYSASSDTFDQKLSIFRNPLFSLHAF